MLRHAFTGVLSHLAGPVWRPTLLLPRAKNHLSFTTSSTQRSTIPRLRPRNVVKLGDKPDADIFEFDEEMHVLSPPVDYGYVSLQLGHRFTEIERPNATHRLANTDEYDIVRKLGWGGEASVWLARRHVKEEPNPHPRFVAIKFLTAYHSAFTIQREPARFEYKALIRFDRSKDHPGKEHCALMQDVFPYFGSKHGPHLCMVFEPYSISLQQYINELREADPGLGGWTIECIKDVVRQVVHALSYVHSVKMIHTAMPDMLRAPEVVLGYPWGTPVDIWSLGCMMYELVSPGMPAFDTRFDFPEGCTQLHALLARIEDVIGPIPMSLLERSTERETYFDFDGRLRVGLPNTASKSSTLETQILVSQLRGSVPDAELHDLARFIRRCLTVDPSERPSADDLLKDPWLAEPS